MSIRVVSWVFDQSPTTGNDRLVLLAIADEANDDGRNAYPSIDRIADKARVNKRTTIRCIERLEERGQLVVHRPEKRGRGHHNTYEVVLPQNGDTLSTEKGAQRRATVHDDAQTVLDPQTHGDPSDRARPKRRITEDWKPEPVLAEWAKTSVPNVDADFETQKFVNHYLASGEARVDWRASWRNWMLRASRDYAPRTGTPAAQGGTVTRERGMVECAFCEDTGWQDVVNGEARRCTACAPLRGVS